MLDDPRISAPQISQVLHGHALDVLEARDEWRRVRSDDDYEGWMHGGYLRFIDPDDPDDQAPEDETMISLGCIARSRTAGRRAIPLGAYLLADDETIESGEAIPLSEAEHRFARDAQAICRTALTRFEGTSYEWGGVTPWGADCSGMVQSVLRLHGVELPRDARLQAEKGADAPREFAALAAADLLFFSDREDKVITHVGIALGGARMVHLALGRGGYAVDVLDDETDPYVAKLRERFRFAKRVL